MNIRRFKDSDAKELSSLIQKTLYEVNIRDSPKFAIKELHEEYEAEELIRLSKERMIYVITEQNKIIGSIANKDNLICTLFVDSKLRGKGVGKQLLSYIENKIKSLGYPKAELVASLSAESFFIRMGYIETKKQYDKEQLTGIFMEKCFR